MGATTIFPARGPLMGAENVKAAFALWGHLPDRAFRAFLYMANRSLDATRDGKPPRTFWGGREELAKALNVTVPGLPESEVSEEVRDKILRARKSAFKTTDKVTAILSGAGAITRIKDPRSGSRAVYRLNLHPFAGGPEDPSQRGAEGPSQGGAQGPSAGGPKEQGRNHQGTTIKEQHSPQVTTSPAPVDDAPPAAPTDPADLIPCPRCGWQTWECQSRGTCKPARTKETAL